MAKHSDLTFITNEQDQNLLERFKVLIEDTELFDVLVGYFYTSGFHALYKSLEKTKQIRILIGISTNKKTADLMEEAKKEKQYDLPFSHAETKEHFSNSLVQEMERSQDSRSVEEGILKFKEWLISGKLEIRAYPTEDIHAKLYIMSFAKEDRDKGRVITGSSNFTKAGFIDNLEFNVELKNPFDYEFAKNKFNELWQNAVDVKDKYIETIQKKTWLNDSITPYQLYLKFLYEYFKDELNLTDEPMFKYLPEKFKHYEYQDQAVRNAKRILDEYGGVFLSDVVGLGKTYMSAMLASQLDGRTLVVAPPILLDKTNPNSWPNVFEDFKAPATCESLGKLDYLIRRGVEKYENVFIDEAHRFRTESNITYEKLTQICRGKKVVLVTATPLNNSPLDILSQIKLFQNARKSTIPNVPNLELFFSEMDKQIRKLDKKTEYKEYMRLRKTQAKKIRELVLKHLMVRRTRTEIENYFKEDLRKQGLKFPDVEDPKPLYYEFNKEEEEVFQRTVELVGKRLSYARYKPLTYYKDLNQLESLEIQSQKNLGVFMKILLIKRLESSFYAFKNTIRRFINSYELFLREFNAGHVYISKEHANKIFELLEDDDDEAIQKLLDEDKAKKYQAKNFDKSLKKDLENDLQTLREIKSLWDKIKNDPKLKTFMDNIYPPQTILLRKTPKGLTRKREENKFSYPVLKKSKLIVFTESKETANYLAEKLNQKKQGKTLIFTGASGQSVRETVIENFDANARFPKDDYRILIATELLSEGVNLHRSNVVINYDIPWNPTRLMQRVGRINRVDTHFDKIWTFNFFPTEQSNDIIKLKETAQAKIHTFISLLGADSRLLTEGEDIESHELFNRLTSKKTIIGEDEGEDSELKYLNLIKNIRDSNPNLFNEIKQLPKKARTAREYEDKENSLLTYFRKGKLQKFFQAEGGKTKELDFITSAKLLEVKKTAQREKIPGDFYDKLEQNKTQFLSVTKEEGQAYSVHRRGRDIFDKLLRILKAIRDFRQWTEEQEAYLKKVIGRIEDGALPKQTAKALLQKWNHLNGTDKQKPLKILAFLQTNIPVELLKGHVIEKSASAQEPREVILSEYLIGK